MHTVGIYDEEWTAAQRLSGLKNPSTYIRQLVSRSLKELEASQTEELPEENLTSEEDQLWEALEEIGIYTEDDKSNLDIFAQVQCRGDWRKAVKALENKSNPPAYLQWWVNNKYESEE
jgi:trimethylamine:corrinoid methyltransferase-like protein